MGCLGSAPHLGKTATLLSRTVEWRHDGVSWEPDPRHVELMIRDLGSQDAKEAGTPGLREHSRRRGTEEVVLDGVWVKAADTIGDVQVCGGDMVRVNGSWCCSCAGNRWRIQAKPVAGGV